MSLSSLLGPLHTRPVKWALLILSLGVALFWALSFRPSPGLSPYEALFLAITAPEKHLPELWRLARREDGAGWVARVELGKTLLGQGEAGKAALLFQEALLLRDSQETRKLLAQALEMQGRRDEALVQWKKLLPAPEAAAAILRLEKDRLSAVKALLAGGAYTTALQALSGSTSPEASLLRARALVRLGRYSEAAQEYARYLAALPSDTGAQLEYGQVLERLGQVEKARMAYSTAGAAAAYPLGLLLEAQGALNEALSAYSRSGDPEAKWRAARLLEAQGRTSEALAIYRELAGSSAQVADDAAFRIYLFLSRQGREKEAASFKTSLGPAFLWLLGEPVPPPSLGPGPGEVAPDTVFIADSLVARFSELGRNWAYIALEIALSTASPAEALAFGEWYAKKGDLRRAYALGVRLVSALPCERAYRLAYPKAWEESVLHWAQEYRVDPFLIWAIMREESGFLPAAVSSSGARGLMQLLPSTARWIAEEKLGIAYHEDLLFDPHYNIRLGAWYIHHLLEQFRGDVVWAIAAYNGGPGNVRRWTTDLVDPLDFPAALPLPQTREYLGKVLSSWLIYRWLYR